MIDCCYCDGVILCTVIILINYSDELTSLLIHIITTVYFVAPVMARGSARRQDHMYLFLRQMPSRLDKLRNCGDNCLPIAG